MHHFWLVAELVKVKCRPYISLAACMRSSVSERRHLKNSFLLYFLWSFCLFPSVPCPSSHMKYFVFHCHPPKPTPSLSVSILKPISLSALSLSVTWETPRGGAAKRYWQESLHNWEIVTSSGVPTPELKLSHNTFEHLLAYTWLFWKPEYWTLCHDLVEVVDSD